MTKKKKTSTNTTIRAGHDGQEFHEAWAARKALQLLFSQDNLKGIAVEGLSPHDEQTAAATAVEIADLVLYYGKSVSFHTSERVVVQQFKYSVVNATKLFQFSDLKKTLQKFAQSFLDCQKQHGAEAVDQKLEFQLITNQPADPNLLKTIEALKSRKPLKGRQKTQAEHFRKACPLRGNTMARFAAKLKIIGAVPDLRDSKLALSRTLASWSPGSKVKSRARLGALKQLVRDKAGSAGAGRNVIRRADILMTLETDDDELFPAKTAFSSIGHVVERAQLSSVASQIPKLEKPLLIKATAGTGKTVFLQSLQAKLQDKHKTILFDCYGGGAYRSPEDMRHRSRRGLVQIANTLAAEGLCDPLLPDDEHIESLIAGFRERLTQAARALQTVSPETQILIFLDAIDNSAQCALDNKESDCFPRLLFETLEIKGSIPGIQFIATCRPERRKISIGDTSPEEITLDNFTPYETEQYVRARIKKATETEVAVAHARSEGNPRVLKHLVNSDRGLLDASEKNKQIQLDQLLEKQIQKALEEARKLGHKKEDIDVFLAGLAVLPPPVPISEYADAHEMDINAVQSFASDLTELLERTKHGLMFKDEPTEDYIRVTYSTTPQVLRRVADILLKAQEKSAYAAMALPALLQKLDDGDRLFDLAFDDRFPSSVKSEVGKRHIRSVRLKTAVHYASLKRDYNHLVKLVLELSTIAAVNQRGVEFIKDHPVLVVTADDRDANRRLFEMRTAWPGTRHARVLIAHILTGDLEQAARHFASLFEFIEHWRESDERKYPDFKGPTPLDIASIPFYFIARGRPAVAIEYMSRWREWYVYEISESLFELLEQAKALGAISEANINSFFYSLKNNIGLLAGAISFAHLPKDQDTKILRALAAACKKVTPADLPGSGRISRQRSIELRGGLRKATALALVHDLTSQAASIAEHLIESVPSAYSFKDEYPMEGVNSFIIENTLKAVAQKKAITARLFLPQELQKLPNGIPDNLVGEAYRKALLVALEEFCKAEASQKDKKPSISYDARQDVEHFINHRMERLERIVTPFATLLSAKQNKADAHFLELIDIWLDLSKQQDGYTNRRNGALLFNGLGRSLVILALSIRQDLAVTSVENLMKKLPSLPIFGISASAEVISLLARRSELHAEAGKLAIKTITLIEGESDVATRASEFSQLAHAILPASREEATAYFRRGLEQLDAISSSDYMLINELLLFASAISQGELKRQEFHTFANICELGMQWEEEKFPWFAFGRGMASVCGLPMLARLGRWHDRDKILLSYTLLPYLSALVQRRRIKPENALGLMQLANPAEMYDLGTGAFARQIHENKYANEPTLLRELIRQFLENNPHLPARSITEQLRDLAKEILGENSAEFTYFASAAPRVGKLINEQNENNNYRSFDERLAPNRAAEMEAEKKRNARALAEIAERTDPLNEASLATAIRDMDELNYIYELKAEFFKVLRNKVAYAQQTIYIENIAKIKGFNVYWKISELEECKSQWAPATQTLTKVLHDLAISIIQIDIESFVDNGSFSGGILQDLLQLTDRSKADLALEFSKILAKSETEYPAAIWLALASFLAEQAEPNASLTALQRILVGNAPRLAGEADNNTWADDLYPSADETNICASFVWLQLGSPLAADRWRAAHSIRSFARLGCWEIIDALIAKMFDENAGPFQAKELPFFSRHARLWLLIALARTAKDSPAQISAYAQQLKKVVSDDNEPHLIMRKFAAQALLACNTAGYLELSPDEYKKLSNVFSSPYGSARPNNEAPHNAYEQRPKDAPRVDFYFDYDFEKYELNPLAEVFGRPAWEVEDLVAKTALRFDASVRNMNEMKGRASERGNRQYGLSDRHHKYGQYLAWHAMHLVAGDLFKKHPVYHREYAPTKDPLHSWLERYLLTRSDGLWFADGMDPSLTPTQLNLQEPGGKRLILTSDASKLQSLIWLSDEKRRQIVVRGNWSSADGVQVFISSALTMPSQSDYLIQELFKEGPYHAHIPSFRNYGSGDEYEPGGEREGFETWIVSPECDSKLDVEDLLGNDVAMERPYFSKEISDAYKLVTTDPFNREWMDPSGEIMAHAEAWGGTYYRDEDSARTGTRLVCSENFLGNVLSTKKADLIVLIKLEKYHQGYGDKKSYFSHTIAACKISKDLAIKFYLGIADSAENVADSDEYN